TTTLLLLLVRERKLRFDDRITRFLPNFGVHGKDPITIRHLLAHCSGLAACRPVPTDILMSTGLAKLGTAGSRVAICERIHRERLDYPTGTRAVYSDLGFIVLGEIVELLTHGTLTRAFHDRVVRPLGLSDSGFIDLTALRVRKLAT